MPKNKKVFVTGLGCICAAGNSVPECMDAMYAGKRSPAASSRIKTGLKMSLPVFAVNTDLNPESKSYCVMFLEEAVKEALADSNLNGIRHKRAGVCIGTTIGCTLNNWDFYAQFRNGENPAAAPITDYLANQPAHYIAALYDLKGPVTVVSNACASGTDAIGLAKAWIESGICDMAIAGGTDELCPITLLGFSSMLITSDEACRPFDKNRKGLNLGEGAGAVILENEASVNRRGITPLAEVSGYGCSADAYHPTAPHPEGRGLKKALSEALDQSGLEPQDIGFVNAHATATPNNDRVEGRVIAEAYKACPVVATKAFTGHTLGAAGSIEAVFTVRALIDQKLPATPGFGEYDPECRVRPTTKNTDLAAEAGVSHSLAFGGNNSVLIFKRILL